METFITSSSVGYKVYNSPDITGCHGNMIYLFIPPRLDEIKKGWVTEAQAEVK